MLIFHIIDLYNVRIRSIKTAFLLQSVGIDK